MTRVRFQRWNYEPCRQEIKTLIAFCEQTRILLSGVELPDEAVKALESPATLPITVLRHPNRRAWAPDKYASFGYEVTEEADEWYGRPDSTWNLRQHYLGEYSFGGGLRRLAEEEGGAAPPPDQPWRPTASTMSNKA